MRRKSLLLFVLAWVGLIGSGPGQAAADNYFPLQPGNRWLYRMEVDGLISEAEIRVAPRTFGSNLDTIQVETITRGVIKQREFYAVAADGVFTVMRSGFRFEPLQCFLKYPVVIGDSWSQTGRLYDNNRRLTFTYIG